MSKMDRIDAARPMELLSLLRDTLKTVDAGEPGATANLIDAVRVIVAVAEEEDAYLASLRAQWQLKVLQVPKVWLDAFLAAYAVDEMPVIDKRAMGASIWLDASEDWRAMRMQDLGGSGGKDGVEALAHYVAKMANRRRDRAANTARVA